MIDYVDSDVEDDIYEELSVAAHEHSSGMPSGLVDLMDRDKELAIRYVIMVQSHIRRFINPNRIAQREIEAKEEVPRLIPVDVGSLSEDEDDTTPSAVIAGRVFRLRPVSE